MPNDANVFDAAKFHRRMVRLVSEEGWTVAQIAGSTRIDRSIINKLLQAQSYQRPRPLSLEHFLRLVWFMDLDESDFVKNRLPRAER